MQNNFKYINLSWAVVGICERPRVLAKASEQVRAGDQRSGMNARQPLLSCIPGIDKDERLRVGDGTSGMAAAVEHYVIGYMAFWHIAFVDESRLVPCNDDTLRTEAWQKIDRYIAERLRVGEQSSGIHPPVETFPRFYLVLLRQPIAPMEPDGMSRVYQM